MAPAVPSHRIIESWSGLGGRDLKAHLAPTPLPRAGTTAAARPRPEVAAGLSGPGHGGGRWLCTVGRSTQSGTGTGCEARAGELLRHAGSGGR